MPELIEKKKAGRFSWLAVAAGCGSLFYYMGCLLVSGLDTSGLWVWPLFSVLCFGTAMLLSKVPTGGFWYLAGKIAAGLTALLFLAFFLFEIGVVWGMTQTAPDTTVSAAEVPDMVLPSAEAADEKAVDGQTGTATKESLDYVIILGGGVVGEQPSPALEQRILTAYDYLKNHPETKVIATGGLGGGRISEAACIARTLEGLSIARQRITLEEQATTTAENFQYSRPLVEDGATVGVVTSNFHIFRSLLLAKSAGFTQVCGIAAPFGGWMFPHYMVREFMTFTVEIFRGNVL